jgi:glycosyltransferase involved in cell wall biosynthesis
VQLPVAVRGVWHTGAGGDAVRHSGAHVVGVEHARGRGDAACYADPADIGDIRRAPRELLTDAALRERCGAAGLERARLFDCDDTARRTLEVLECLGR